ncbi:MAG: regulatory iron-sulfur-containing complex subunit RicT [bacterium]|nr:regulatory iron-sulfur-containing complex subunit RicT [bacterium]
MRTATKYVGVHLATVTKPTCYDPGELTVRAGELVVVETSRGLELGKVILPAPYDSGNVIICPIVRSATLEDIATEQRHRLQAAEALAIIRSRVYEFDLPMQILSGSITLDGNCIVVEFAAENRIDFRHLVKDLAPRLRKRIELHQIGTRDRATLIGGLGLCGRQLCCENWLKDFSSISIKMAKLQGIMFNPYRISGACGRLMCCLKYEHQVYSDFTANLPKLGDTVKYEDDKAKVVGYNIARNTISLQRPEKGIVEISIEEAKQLQIIATYEQNANYSKNEDSDYLSF